MLRVGLKLCPSNCAACHCSKCINVYKSTHWSWNWLGATQITLPWSRSNTESNTLREIQSLWLIMLPRLNTITPPSYEINYTILLPGRLAFFHLWIPPKENPFSVVRSWNIMEHSLNQVPSYWVRWSENFRQIVLEQIWVSSKMGQ